MCSKEGTNEKINNEQIIYSIFSYYCTLHGVIDISSDKIGGVLTRQ